MRSFLSKALSTVLTFGLVALPANAAPVTAPMGVVVLADQARVGDDKAVNGSTVFQDDRLATGETGRLQVRFGATQALLFPGSLAVVNQTPGGLNADLLSGTLSLSSALGETFSLTANKAVVRPVPSQAAVAQVTRVSPGELLLSSRKGTLEVTFDGEVTTLTEGSSYRMLIDPAAADPQAPQGTRASSRSRKRAIFILLGAAAAVTGIAIAATQGSSSPVSPSTP